MDKGKLKSVCQQCVIFGKHYINREKCWCNQNLIKASCENIYDLSHVLSKFKNVDTVILTKCNICSLSALPPNLTIMIFDHNKISSINENVLPKTLKIINLSYNELTSFTIKDNSNINTIYLQKNKLKDLDVINCNNLEKINVNDNPSVFLNFENLNSLKELSMSNCNQKTLPRLTDSLLDLDASQNYLTEFDPNEFPNLTFLNLTCNYVSSLTFHNNLVKIFASVNKLSELVYDDTDSKLEDIYCSYNNITKIRINCPKLKTIVYNYNPINEEEITGFPDYCNINFKLIKSNCNS